MVTLSPSGEITTRLIVLLIAIIIVIFSASIYYIYKATGSSYAATYFTLATLFDYSTITGSASVQLYTVPNTVQFDTIFIVAVVDGLAKAVLIGFVIATFINALMSLDIRAKMGNITARSMKNHVVVCGYSQLAERLCTEFRKRGTKFVIIEKSQDKVDILTDLGYRVIAGDFTKDETLKKAKVDSAQAIVFVSDSEFINLLGVVTAHHLYPSLRIVSKAKEESTITKMHRAGAELCIVPEIIAGLDIGNAVFGRVL